MIEHVEPKISKNFNRGLSSMQLPELSILRIYIYISCGLCLASESFHAGDIDKMSHDFEGV